MRLYYLVGSLMNTSIRFMDRNLHTWYTFRFIIYDLREIAPTVYDLHSFSNTYYTYTGVLLCSFSSFYNGHALSVGNFSFALLRKKTNMEIVT